MSNTKKVKFDIEDDEEGRITISINGIGEVILAETFPEYEFLEDVGEDGIEEVGVEEGDLIGKIEHIEIEDEYKGQGYAKLLMEKAIEVAKEKGLMPLYLNASPMGSKKYGLNIDNLTGLYESLGFEVFLRQGGNNLMILKDTYKTGGETKNKIMAKQIKIQFADDNYANGGVTYSEWSKDDFWQEQFNDWKEDGNVSKNADGTYSTQDAQYTNSLRGMVGLKKYFYNEFIKGQYAGGGKAVKKYVVVGVVYDGGEVWKETFDNLEEAIDLARGIQNGWTDDGTYYLITIYNETGKKVAEISDDKYFNELTENKLFKKFDLSANTKKTRQIENEKLNGYKFKLEVLIADGGATVIYEKTFDSIFDVMDKMNTYYEENYYALINGKELDYWEEEYSEINASRNFIKGKDGWSFIKEGNLWIAKDDYDNNYIVRLVNGKNTSDSSISKGALKQIMELEAQKKYSEKPKHNNSLSDMKKIWDKLSENYKEREDIAFLVGYYGGVLRDIVPKKWDDINKGTQIDIMNAYFGQTEEQKQKRINEYRKRHEALVKEHKTLRNLYGLEKKGFKLFGIKIFEQGGSTDDNHLMAKAIEFIIGSAIDTNSIEIEPTEISYKRKNTNVRTSIDKKLIEDTIRMHGKSLKGRFEDGGDTNYFSKKITNFNELKNHPLVESIEKEFNRNFNPNDEYDNEFNYVLYLKEPYVFSADNKYWKSIIKSSKSELFTAFNEMLPIIDESEAEYRASGEYEYADGGEVKVNGMTKKDYNTAYEKRIAQAVRDAKKEGVYFTETNVSSFDYWDYIEEGSGFTANELVGSFIGFQNYLSIWLSNRWDEKLTKLDIEVTRILCEFYFGKPMFVNISINTGSDLELVFEDELKKIKLLSNKIDFDEVKGNIESEQNKNNTNLKFYKDGILVMNLKGDYNEATEELDTTLEVNGETVELNYHPLDSMGGVSMEQLEKNIDEALREINTYSAVVSIEGYEEYAEDVEGLENAKALIQDIKGNTRFQVLKGSSVGIGKRVDDSRVVEEFAKGGEATFDVTKLDLDNPISSRVYYKGVDDEINKILQNDYKPVYDFDKKGIEWVYKNTRYVSKDEDLIQELKEALAERNRGIVDMMRINKQLPIIESKYGKDVNFAKKMHQQAKDFYQNKLWNEKSIKSNEVFIDYLISRLKESKKEFADGGEAGFDDANTSMVIYHEEKGNPLIPKNQIYLWLYEGENASEKLESGEYDFVMYPYASLSISGQKGFIPPLKKIWTKKFQKQNKGSEHLIGVIKAHLLNDGKELYIDMMSVNPTKKKKGVMSYMIKDLRDTYNLTQDQVTFSNLTDEGKKFVAKKTYGDGGEIKYDLDGNKYMIDNGNYEPFKDGDLAYNPFYDSVVSIYFDKNDENADNEDYVNNTYSRVKIIESFADGGGLQGNSNRNETQENNFGVSYKLGDKFTLGRKFGNKDEEVFITEIMPSGLFFKVDKSSKIFSIKTLHSRGATYTSGEYLVPIKKEYANGGGVGEPVIIVTPRYSLQSNNTNRLEYNELIEYLDNHGWMYEKNNWSSNDMELPIINIFINKRKEKSSTTLSDLKLWLSLKNWDYTNKFADGGEIYVHKYNPNITLEFIENTNKGIKGLQKNPKSLSKKERNEGIIVNYSDSEIKELFNKKFADGGDTEEVYIEFLNKEKGFKKDTKYFNSYEEAVEWAKQNFEKFNPDMIKYKYANGGEIVKFYTKENERLGRPSGSMEKEILDKVRDRFEQNQFVGSMGWKTPQGKLADGYLYKLDDFDRNVVSNIRLKATEKIFRYFNRTTAIGGITPFIKINLENGMLYFDNSDNNDIQFETKGVKALWVSLIEDNMEYADGGDVPHEDKMFQLPLEMVVYVPSTQDVDKVISVDKMDKRVDEVKEYLASKFGGYTSSDKLGGYVDSTGNLVNEDVVQVTSFSTQEAYDENKEELIQQLAKWGKQWGQEAIGFEFEGDLMYVPQELENETKVDEYRRGGFMYEVQKKGSPSNDMRETMFTAKNLTELKKKIIEKYGTSEGFMVSRRTEQGYYAPVKFKNGGSTDAYNSLTRGEIEDKIAGLRLRIAKTKKQISTFETTNRGKYNNLWEQKVVPLQKELDLLSDLFGNAKYSVGGGTEGLNKVLTSKEGNRFIYTDKIKAVDDYEMDGWEQTIWLGIQLMPENYSSNEVVVSENELFIGDYEVRDYKSYVEKFSSFSNQIPKLFVIRTYDEKMKYYSFECGFDLLDNGGAWDGMTNTKHNTIADALRIVREKVGEDFVIFMEEPMQL